MENYNFGSLVNTKGVSSNHTLRAYDIHDVIFDEAKIDQIEIKKGENAGKKLDVLKVKFSNDNGYYEETVFYPTTDKDASRSASAWGGENPSNFDRALMFIAHVAQVINKEGFVEIKNATKEGKIKKFDDLAQMFVEIVNKNKGFATHLKLVGKSSNGYIQACLPFYCGINKEGEAYVKDNFLGENLSFSASEKQKKASYENSKPTNMSSGVNDASSDLNDDLLRNDKGIDTNDIEDLVKDL